MSNKPTYEELEQRVKELEKDAVKLKKAEEKLQDSQFLFSEMFEQSTTSMQLFDPDGYCLRVNSKFCEMFGVPVEDIIDGKYNILKDQNLMSPRISKLMEEIFSKQMVNRWEGRYDIGISADLFGISTSKRKQIDIDTLGYPILDNSGQLKYVVFHTHDITERKQVEKALRQSELRLNEAQRVAHVGSWELDVLAQKLWWSDECYRIFGFAKGEFGNTMEAFFETVHPEDHDLMQKTTDASWYDGKPFDVDHRIILPNGEIRIVHEQAEVIFDEAGQPIKMIGTVRDITERKQTEDTLLKNQYYLTKSQEIGVIGTWEMDIQKNILKWTDENYKIFGIPLGTEMNYEKFLDCIHPDDRDYVQKNRMAALNNEPYDIDHRVIVNNEVKWVRQKAFYEFDAKGNPIMAIGFTQDITERKLAEEQIKASLKEKEVLLQEIHHRVKNNMTVISSLLGLQANSINDERLTAALKDSQNRVQSMSAIHEVLYQSENLSSIDMNIYLSNLSGAIAQNYTISSKVNVRVESENILIGAKQASPLGLVVNELITNSYKYAFPDNQEGKITISLIKTVQDQIELEYADNGVGIPKAFDWYKAKSMGLKLVRTLVENQLDGSIDMESNKGTKFTIKFNIET